ncbi:8065_t:CDS:1, partial [Funneliformis mosseae]
METSSLKIINKVIENIILTTDNNNQTPNNTNESTTKAIDIEINNNIPSTSDTTEP